MSLIDVKETSVAAYLSAGRTGLAAAAAAIEEISPVYVDDVTRGVHPETYEQMLTDGEVESAFDTRKLAILDPGITLQPAEGNDDTKEVRLSVLADVQDAIAGFDLYSVASELADGDAYGVNLCEIVLRIDEDGRYAPDRIPGVDRSRYLLCRDKNGRFLGAAFRDLLTEEDAEALLASSDEADELREARVRKAIVPAWKLLRYAPNAKNGSLVGQSVLRSAYTAWFCKNRLLPEYLKFLARFGSPSIFGTTDARPTVKLDMENKPILVDGKPLMTEPLMDLMRQLVGWENARVAVGPVGTEIDYLEPKTKGEALSTSLQYFDRQIHQAILGTSQATKEAQSESRSSKAVGQDVLGLRISAGRRGVGSSLDPLMRLLVRLNRGESYVRFAPRAVIAQTEAQDILTEAQAFETVSRAISLTESQEDWFCNRIGMPLPTEEEREQRRLDRQSIAGDLNKLNNP